MCSLVSFQRAGMCKSGISPVDAVRGHTLGRPLVQVRLNCLSPGGWLENLAALL